MCGRFALTLPPEAMRRLLRYPEQPNFPPRYNIAPTQPVAVVTLDADGRHFGLMRWGFLPGWVRDPKAFPLVINVRAETMQEKTSFRAAFLRRRALMPADGFYEWQREGRQKKPFLFRRPDRGGFAFAALWERWNAPDGSEIDTVAMVTTMANGLMSALHHRSPVILDPADHARWLDPATVPAEAAALCRPPPEDLLEMLPVNPAVNAVAHDGPAMQEPTGAVVRATSDRAVPDAPGTPDPQGRLF